MCGTIKCSWWYGVKSDHWQTIYVSPLPDDIVFVWFEGLTQVYEELHPMYTMEAFVTLDVWRQQQIDKLI